MITTIIVYGVAGILLLLSAISNKKKTRKALKKALMGFTKLLPALVAMLIFIAIMLSIVDEQMITRLLGGSSGIGGTILGLAIGSTVFLPGFVALPLGASLLEHGAGLVQIAAFVGGLIGVGILSLPVEIKYFGRSTAITRNIWGLIAASAFAALVWVFL